jgi:hypothetical protein
MLQASRDVGVTTDVECSVGLAACRSPNTGIAERLVIDRLLAWRSTLQ